MDCPLLVVDSGRGAFQWRRRLHVSVIGAIGNENVGMSNDKCGKKPHRRKTKGSCIYARQSRVSRDLRRTREGKSMENRLIFRYLL